MIKASSENGSSFSVEQIGESDLREVELLFNFQLNWAQGSVTAVCSEERFAEFVSFVKNLKPGIEEEHDFINENGNLEIITRGLFTGRQSFEVIAIPSMVDDDRIEIGFEGTVFFEE